MGKPKAKKKKSSLTGILTKLAVISASAYLVYAFVGGRLQVAQKQRELEAITAQLDALAQQNNELQTLMESGDEDAYIEFIARSELGYAYPDEKIYIDISGR